MPSAPAQVTRELFPWQSTLRHALRTGTVRGPERARGPSAAPVWSPGFSRPEGTSLVAPEHGPWLVSRGHEERECVGGAGAGAVCQRAFRGMAFVALVFLREGNA